MVPKKVANFSPKSREVLDGTQAQFCGCFFYLTFPGTEITIRRIWDVVDTSCSYSESDVTLREGGGCFRENLRMQEDCRK